MISTDFAPNENWDDALLSLSLLFQPWRWKQGKETNELRKQLSSFFPKASAHLFLTGRSALYYFFLSLNLEEDSEVIVPGFTCEAVVLPIISLKLKPVYVDINAETYSLDPQDLEKKITNKTKVIVLQHTFGIPPQRKQILEIAQKNDLTVIEDLAHGFEPLTFKNDQINTTKLLSFGRSKSFSSVFGGAIISFDTEITEQLNKAEKSLELPSNIFILRTLLYKPLSVLIKTTYDIYIGKTIHKLVNLLGILIPEITQKEKRGEYNVFFNKSYPNALAVLLLHQLKKLDKKQVIRELNCRTYDHAIKGFPKEWPLIRYPVLVENREKIMRNAQTQNIFLGKWYNQVVAPKELNLDKVYYQKGSCPQAEKITFQIINLPTNVTFNEALKVLKLFK